MEMKVVFLRDDEVCFAILGLASLMMNIAEESA